MRRDEAFIDTNLLVLLVVGSVDRRIIATHRRTRTFTPEDYDWLLEILDDLDQVYVTPNTLTEASNLLKSSTDTRFLETLQRLIEISQEVVVAGATAAKNPRFTHLGLTDSVLLEVVSEERPLLTVDLELYSAALGKGEEAAINFTRYQDF